MATYLIRRLLHMIPILFGVALLTFLLFSVFGEDPVSLTLGNHATPESIAALKALWGLDQPLHIQFIEFLRQIVTFDYGVSYSTGESLTAMFKEGAVVSLMLTVPPFVIGTIINISLSLLIAYNRGTWLDRISTVASIAMMSISYLVYIIVLQYLLTYKIEIFPVMGFEYGWEAPVYLMLPWLIIMIVSIGPDIRIYRTVFLDETKADYIRTARAKGASENRVLFVHLFKNAMIPILTNTIITIPFLFMGAFVLERYFSLPGIGSIMINAINEGDFPILKAMTVLTAFMYSIFNLLTDVMYAVVDPRVKLG